MSDNKLSAIAITIIVGLAALLITITLSLRSYYVELAKTDSVECWSTGGVEYCSGNGCPIAANACDR